MSQLHAFGQTSEAAPSGPTGDPAPASGEPSGMPGQAGPPVTEQVPSSPRSVKPLHLAAIGGAAVLVAGAVAWVLLGGSGDVAVDPAPSAASPSVAASASPSLGATVSPAPPGVAGRNPFVGTAGGAAPAGVVAAGGLAGGAVTVTSTVTNQVTATVSVPVVSTVTRSVTATTTVTAEPIYVFLHTWDGTTAQVSVNSESISMRSGSTKQGVTMIGVDPADSNCVLVKPAGAATADQKSVCTGGSVRFG